MNVSREVTVAGRRVLRDVVEADSERAALDALFQSPPFEVDPEGDYSVRVGGLVAQAYGDEFARMAGASTLDEEDLVRSTGGAHLHGGGVEDASNAGAQAPPDRYFAHERARAARRSPVRLFDEYGRIVAEGVEGDGMVPVAPCTVVRVEAQAPDGSWRKVDIGRDRVPITAHSILVVDDIAAPSVPVVLPLWPYLDDDEDDDE